MEEVELKEEKKGHHILIKILLFLLTIVGLVFCYMYFFEPKTIITHEYAIVNEALPDSFNGFKIAHFSDIHFGRTTNEKEVQKVVSLLNEMKPDIIVFTGDLFDNYITLSEDNKEFLKSELSKLSSTIGKYAVMGDTDYIDEGAFKEIMEGAGFTILENTNVPIYYEGNTPIYLSGVSSITKESPDYTNAFKKTAEGNFYQILLCHEPILFRNVSNDTNLVLSGHSLGGLVRIPFLGGLIKKDNVGEYELGKYTTNSSTLFVSNGIGTENLSLRFLNYPSINLYRMYNYE